LEIPESQQDEKAPKFRQGKCDNLFTILLVGWGLWLREVEVEPAQGGEILVFGVADNAVIEALRASDLGGGGLEAPFYFAGVVGGAMTEPLFDLIEGLRFDEN
jgi:hypothetical protein